MKRGYGISDETVQLRSGSSLLEVVPGAGGVITRYAAEIDGRVLDWLRPAVGTDQPTDTSCFPLVPFSNRIRDAQFTFGDHYIQLTPNFPPEPHAIHGHGWRAAWTVVERSDDRLSIWYEHPADEWPWSYRARQTYELSDALKVTFAVENLGDEEMPLGFGLHPYFVRTERTRVSANLENVWLSGDDPMPRELVPLPADMQLPSGIDPNEVALDNNFTGWDGRALIEWLDRDARCTLTAEGPFTTLIVFTPPGEDYVCVEPATNVIDAFNLEASGRTDTGTIHLAAGDTATGVITFRPEA